MALLSFTDPLDTNVPIGESEETPQGVRASAYFEDFLFNLLRDLQNIALDVGTLITTPVTVGAQDVILVDDDVIGGPALVNLPAAADNAGRRYYIKKLGTTANVTIDANGSETIDDGLTAILTVQYEALTIVSDGANWWIL